MKDSESLFFRLWPFLVQVAISIFWSAVVLSGVEITNHVLLTFIFLTYIGIRAGQN